MPQQYPIRLDISRQGPAREAPPAAPGFGDVMRNATARAITGTPGLPAAVLPAMAVYNSMQGSGGPMPPARDQGSGGGFASVLMRDMLRTANRARQGANSYLSRPGVQGALQVNDFVKALTGQDANKMSWAALGKAVNMMPAAGKPVAADDQASLTAQDLGRRGYEQSLAVAMQDPDPQSQQEKIAAANRNYLDLLQMLAASKVTLDQQLNVPEE